MWAPPDLYGLPSKQENQETQLAILELETRLETIRQDAELTPNAVQELEQELEQRRAWIAPIRRLPHDILSIIFLQLARDNWKALFTLGGVSRTWRQSLLDTPRAWTYIPLHRIINSEAILSIIERSSPCSLYIDGESGLSGQLILAMENHTERVGCIKTNGSYPGIYGTCFPNLTKLALSGGHRFSAPGDPRDLLDATKFPNLRCLDTGTLIDRIKDTLLPDAIFPPIEELAMSTGDPNFAAHIIQKLAQRLTTLYLDLTIPEDPVVLNPTEIHFPRLLNLTIIAESTPSQPNLWPFHASTPILHSYQQLYYNPNNPWECHHNLHGDTGTVKRLACALNIDFTRFPQLQEVCSNTPGVRHLLRELKARPQDWPHLERISAGDLFEEEIARFNREYGRNIQWCLTPSWRLIIVPQMEWEEYAD